MADSLLVQLLLGEVPEEVKERTKHQRKVYQNKIRREVSETYRKRINARRRDQYKKDPEFRAKISEYRKKWWASKTEEERQELYFRAKLNRIARQQSTPEEILAERMARERERKSDKYKKDPEYKATVRARERERRANMTDEDRKRQRERAKATFDSLSPEEKARRYELARERCRRHRAKKKMQSISNDQGQDHGSQQEHSCLSSDVGDTAP